MCSLCVLLVGFGRQSFLKPTLNEYVYETRLLGPQCMGAFVQSLRDHFNLPLIHMLGCHLQALVKMLQRCSPGDSG